MRNRLDSISQGKIIQIRDRLLKAQAQGKKVYRFESGDPSFDVSRPVLRAIIRAAEAGKTHYVANDGIPELRRELRNKLEAKNGIHLPSTEEIYVTNGAMHGLYVTWQSLLAEGDEVLVPDPMWTEAVENIRLAGGRPVPVVLMPEDGYLYRPEALAEKIGPKTRAIFVNSPHNPTGVVLAKETLLGILDLAEERGLYLVTDEAYEDIVYDAPHHSLAALAEERGSDPAFLRRIISVFSFSKSYAMSGLRVGYVVVRDPAARQRISKILRCTVTGVNSVAQWAAVEALTSGTAHLEGMLREYRERRELMLQALSGVQGLRPFKPQGAFYCWCAIEPELYRRLGVRDADELSERLAEQGIGSAPGDSFGEHCEHGVRFAFSCATPMVVEGTKALARALHR